MSFSNALVDCKGVANYQLFLIKYRSVMKNKLFLLCFIGLIIVNPIHSQRSFVHPGLTYTQADLDRMKTMVKAKQEPFYSTYKELVRSEYSQIGSGEYGNVYQIKEGEFNGTIGRSGRRAHDRALLYHITGDSAYADDAVRLLNRFNTLTNASARGTAALDNGKLYLLLEAAELLRNYDGWKEEDQQAFKKMLVYPFYSTTVDASATHKHGTDDSKNNVTFYWNIYNYDAGRWGNQGLFAARSLLAMGVYLDNDTIYDRAIRYLAAEPGREDDLPYGKLPIKGGQKSNNGYVKEFNISWSRNEQIADEALKYYIYANGQCQEACRDQAHVLAGIGNYTAIAEIAWNQGDVMYDWLDNRILTAVEYAIRYNLSNVVAYPDQSTPWEPTGSSKIEDDCTYDNGVFYQALSRSNRWEAVAISPDARGANPKGWTTQVLQHYKVRAGLPEEKYKWLQRSNDRLIAAEGIENWGVAPNWYYEWTGWGTLTKYRTKWMTGNPGTWNEMKFYSGLPSIPTTLKAVDFDYYASEGGRGKTYFNDSQVVNSIYRTDDITADIQSEGDAYVLANLSPNDWYNYTIGVPVSGNYALYITYKTDKTIKLTAAIDDKSWKESVFQTSSEFTEFKLGDFDIENGSGVLRLKVLESDPTLKIKNIRFEYAPEGESNIVFEGQLTYNRTFSMNLEFQNIFPENINILRSPTDDLADAVVISENNAYGEFVDSSVSGAVAKYHYWIQYTENDEIYYSDPISFEWGFFFDDFQSTDTENAPWMVAGQGEGVVSGNALNITYTDAKAYYRRTEPFSFHAGNYPILAFYIDMPDNASFALHASASKKFGGDNDKYTGKLSENIYYYDLSADMFKANENAPTGDQVPTDSIMTINSLQIRQAVSSDNDLPTKLYWAGTFRSLSDLTEFVSGYNTTTQDLSLHDINYFVTNNLIQFNNLPAHSSIDVYAVSGKHIFSNNRVIHSSVAIPVYEHGMYIVTVRSNELLKTFKIMK